MQYAVDLVLAAIFVITIAVSVKKGFFLTLFELAGYIVSVLAARIFSSQFAPAVFDAVLKEPASRKITSLLGKAGTIDYKEAISGIFDKIPNWALGITEGLGIEEESVMQSISSSELSGSNAVETIMNKIITPIGTSVIRVILFVILSVVFMFVLKTVIKLHNKIIKKLPVFKELNSVLGGVLGAVKGAVIVIIVAVAVITLSGLAGSEEFTEAVNSSFVVESIKGILTSVSGYNA